MDLLAHCEKKVKEIDCAQWLIGYSGGKDSSVLLDVFVKLKKSGVIKSPLFAIHVNHNISPNSDVWVKHCKKQCDYYDIPLIIENVTKPIPPKQSIEAFAREQRYTKIKLHLEEHGCFISAHHQRDQAETVLLQLMRGAGIDGLKAMSPQKILGQGIYLRPLLDIAFSEIEHYAKQHQIQYVEDESNANERLSRNYMRHQVLPVLEGYFPSAQKKIAQSAEWLSEIEQVRSPYKLNVNELLSLKLTEQKQQIKSYFKKKTGQAIHSSALIYVCNHHVNAGADKRPKVNVGRFIIRRFKDDLCITEGLPNEPLYEKLSKKVKIEDAFTVNGADFFWKKGEGIANTERYFDVKPLQFDQKIDIHIRHKRCTIKKLFNELAIPYWLRSQYFGLYYNLDLVAIPSVGVIKNFYQKNEKAQMPLWQIDKKFVKI